MERVVCGIHSACHVHACSWSLDFYAKQIMRGLSQFPVLLDSLWIAEAKPISYPIISLEYNGRTILLLKDDEYERKKDELMSKMEANGHGGSLILDAFIKVMPTITTLFSFAKDFVQC